MLITRLTPHQAETRTSNARCSNEKITNAHSSRVKRVKSSVCPRHSCLKSGRPEFHCTPTCSDDDSMIHSTGQDPRRPPSPRLPHHSRTLRLRVREQMLRSIGNHQRRQPLLCDKLRLDYTLRAMRPTLTSACPSIMLAKTICAI